MSVSTLDKLDFVLDNEAGYYVKSKYKQNQETFEISDDPEGEIVIPDFYNNLPVTGVLDQGFYMNSKITSIYFPFTIMEIGEAAFLGCTSLEKINLLTSTVVSIGHNAFASCKSLKTIDLPDTVLLIEDAAFRNCDSLESINVDTNNVYFSSQNGVLYNYEKTKLLAFPSMNKEEIIFPDGLTIIGKNAFESNKTISSITLPKTLKTIEEDAFSYCELLKTISLPNGLEEIKGFAFNRCSSLESIALPQTLRIIGKNAFSNCVSTKSITIPGNVVTISQASFSNNSSLEQIKIENGVENISQEAFIGCKKVKKVELPNSIKKIEDYSFSVDSIEEFKFNGTIAEWQTIEKTNYWCKSDNMIQFVVQCTDGTTKK